MHEGIYRECISPKNGGTGEFNRIAYKAAEGEKVSIKGSEIIKGWEIFKGTVWKVELDNSFFADFNPFAKRLFGDWFVHPLDFELHLGEVYLNGKSFYEAKTIEELIKAEKRTEGFPPPWSKQVEKILHPEDTIYQWYAEVLEDKTIIYANFQKEDPNKEIVEINVRESVFYPEKNNVNYITISGFELSQSASRWAPPTGNQVGLIGPNWATG
ncbi:MAG: hypothetical protein LBD41_03855, partial [Clostridiales Family XIII bacterium]|nr:hypothetical protein [Clostridiales Family XIII bacterium]